LIRAKLTSNDLVNTLRGFMEGLGYSTLIKPLLALMHANQERLGWLVTVIIDVFAMILATLPDIGLNMLGSSR
jgi:hypothetical protein